MGIFTDSNEYQLRKALRELLEAIDLVEDMTFTRDIPQYKVEAIWDSAMEYAKRTLKGTV